MLFQWAAPYSEYRGHIVGFDGEYVELSEVSRFAPFHVFRFYISLEEMRKRGWAFACPD
jgi:hypothetical protein